MSVLLSKHYYTTLSKRILSIYRLGKYRDKLQYAIADPVRGGRIVTERVPLGTRVDEDVIARFREYVKEHKDRIRGEMGREVERALREYMDRDRLARIEENQEELLDKIEDLAQSLSDATHAHTNTTGSPTAERTREIAERLQNEAEGPFPTVLEDDVERAITDIGGGDPRTIEKYKRNLKSRHLVFEHPWNDHRYWWVDGTAFAEFILETTPQYEEAVVDLYGKDWWESRLEELDPTEKDDTGSEEVEVADAE